MALLSTNHKCTHPCLLLLRRESWSNWRWCWVLGVRNPQSIACEVWSLRFQDKLYNSGNLLIVVILFYVILLLIIHLWCLYMYETWSWHTYSYAFGFVLKTGCDSQHHLLFRQRCSFSNNLMGEGEPTFHLQTLWQHCFAYQQQYVSPPQDVHNHSP